MVNIGLNPQDFSFTTDKKAQNLINTHQCGRTALLYYVCNMYVWCLLCMNLHRYGQQQFHLWWAPDPDLASAGDYRARIPQRGRSAGGSGSTLSPSKAAASTKVVINSACRHRQNRTDQMPTLPAELKSWANGMRLTLLTLSRLLRLHPKYVTNSQTKSSRRYLSSYSYIDE